MSANVLDGAITGTKLAPGVLAPPVSRRTLSSRNWPILALEASNAFGRLDVYHTGARHASHHLARNGSQIQTFDGSDGAELIRLWGAQLWRTAVEDSNGHQTAATLSASGSAGSYLNSTIPTALASR
jgi:hypothetical protein